MPRTWNVQLDSELLEAKAAGTSFSEVAVRLGVSRSAAIGRYHRLAKNQFPSQGIGLARAEYLQERAGKRWKQDAAIRQFDLALSCGANRDDEIRRAVAAGCSKIEIARRARLSRWRVSQIVG